MTDLSLDEAISQNVKPFSFTGTAREYFGIWIVNLLLSIVTLGIYTAWAKVRRLRYFYGNTWLDGHNFEYHAQPKQILIGRIIVVGLLLVYNVLVNITPWALLLLIPYLIAIPWVINKAIQFNARMTSYRNIRLGFEGSYWRSMGVFVGMPLLALASFGILLPVASRLTSNYIGNGLRFGTSKFRTDAPLGDLYKNLGATILFVVCMILAISIVGFLFALVGSGGNFLSEMTEGGLAGGGELVAQIGIVVSILAIYLALILAYVFYQAGVRNIAYNATALDGNNRFRSNLSRLQYFWIILSNLIVTIATIGLMRPWAAIRTWRYKAEHTSILAGGDFDKFVADRQEEGNVVTAEYLDIEGIDFGL